MSQALEQVKRALAEARSVVVIVGDGLSAEPGGPHVSDTWVGVTPEHIATLEEFRQDPGRVWRWHLHRQAQINAYQKGDAHRALAALCAWLPELRLMTSNVDGVLGSADSKPLELHGSIWRTRCMRCDRVQMHGESTREAILPRCDHCDGLLRPDVVWFGEVLNPNVLDQAVRAACLAQVMLLVGTQSCVQPAASLAAHARENDALVVEVGPHAKVAGFTQIALAGEIADVLEALTER